jgi:septal ring-binding cell division protein DamX
MANDKNNIPFSNESVDYEEQDFKARWLVAAGFSILVLVFVAMFVISALIRSVETRQLETQPEPSVLLGDRPTPPAPRLQPNPIDRTTAEEDMETMYARDTVELNRYAWVDKEAGVARIPVDLAIDLLTPDDSGPAR